MNVLVLGKNSQIGKELLALNKPLNLKFFYTSSKDLNIINQNHIKMSLFILLSLINALIVF